MQLAPDIALLDNLLEQVKLASPAPEPPPLSHTQQRELDLWHDWHHGGRQPEAIQPLFESFRPLIERHARTYVNRVELPTSAIYSELNRHFVNALKSYDPAKGTQLNTWVHANLQKVSRFVKSYQNLGKIPEAQISKIREFNQAKETLQNKLGYEPDAHALSEHLGWHPRKVAQLQRELSRRDLPASSFALDPAEHLHPRELEAVQLIQYDLAPHERTVYEYTFGMNGRPVLAPGQIATKTGLHPSKVSRIRKDLQAKVQGALQVL